MTRKVKTALRAARALRQAQLWLLQPGSGLAAAKRAESLRHVARFLRDQPYAGRAIPHNPSFRQLTIAGYLFIYTISPAKGQEETAGDIEIVDIFGPGPDPNAP
jgi:plasmid stabilization system protein ParE